METKITRTTHSYTKKLNTSKTFFFTFTIIENIPL